VSQALIILTVFIGKYSRVPVGGQLSGTHLDIQIRTMCHDPLAREGFGLSHIMTQYAVWIRSPTGSQKLIPITCMGDRTFLRSGSVCEFPFRVRRMTGTRKAVTCRILHGLLASAGDYPFASPIWNPVVPLFALLTYIKPVDMKEGIPHSPNTTTCNNGSIRT
jgi:hypothetical protein